MDQPAKNIKSGSPETFKKRCVLIILDGLGDLPVAALNGQTPLEAADTSFLNKMASNGMYGLLDPIMPGEIPNTHSGTGMLMGMLTEQAQRLHRGPVEAAGAGRVLGSGEVALRANFATLEKRDNFLFVTDRRAGRCSSGTAELSAILRDVDLGDGVSASLLPTDQHRAALVLSGPGLDANISNTDPGDCRLPTKVRTCTAITPEAQFTADKVNRYIDLAFKRLHKHPVNIARQTDGMLAASGIITRGAGAQFSLGNIFNNFGINAAVVSGCNTVLGVGRIFGFTALNDPRFTACFDTDIEAKIAAAISALKNHEMVFLHLKAPDICSHDREPLKKRDFLERFDKALEPLLTSGAVIALGADHTTDSNSGFHTADPVPSLIWKASSVQANRQVNFGENVCKAGNMERILSSDFLLKVLRSMGYQA